MNFNNGNDNNNSKSNSYYVRAVREGKCDLLSFEALFGAYLNCRKRKRGTLNASSFEFDLLGNMFELALEIQKGTYRPSRSVCFITQSPKLREVFAADFRDRVVHHLVVRELEKHWEPRFIFDSYACRPKKGVHAAVNRLREFMRKASKNGKTTAYYLQLDIRSFFMSIDKNILFKLFEDRGTGDELLYLIGQIVFHDCAEDYIFKGDPSFLEKIPPHKSLFKIDKNKGLPIGNLTSQFFANVYLNELDRFVKHQLRCRFYLRYVDDFVLVGQSPNELMDWQDSIRRFLHENLALELKGEGILRRVSEGADFLGYIVRPNYVLVRNRVVNNLKYRLAKYRDGMIGEFEMGGKTYKRIRVQPEEANRLRQTISSYLGHFKHANSKRLVGRILSNHSWLLDLFKIEKGKFKNRFETNRQFRSMRMQINFFRIMYPDRVLLFRVGNFIELYDDDATMAGDSMKCELKSGFRGIRRSCGFPRRLLPVYQGKILEQGKKIAMVEQGGVGLNLRQRYVGELLQPCG